MTVFVFPDTNIFLHYKPLDEIDLPTLLSEAEVVLVVSPIVIRELDNAKWDKPLENIRQRAARSLKQIETWTEPSCSQEIRLGVRCDLGFQAKSETFRNHSLDERSNDDWLIANLLEYTGLQGTDKVYLLTADTGPRLKARQFSIQVANLPDEYKLPQSADTYQKEIAKLNRELLEYKNKVPHFQVGFASGDEELTVNLPQRYPSITQEEIQTKLDKLKGQAIIPLEDEPGPKGESASRLSIDSLSKGVEVKITEALSQPTPDEKRRYRREYQDYLKKYREFIVTNDLIRSIVQRTILIHLKLGNIGTVYAEDVTLLLTLPAKLRWQLAIDRHSITPPEAPEPPRSVKDVMADMNMVNFNPLSAIHLPNLDLFRDVDKTLGPSIEKGVLKWRIDEIPHNGYMILNPVYAIFNSGDDISNFSINYTIGERNTPKLIEGSLLVRVTTE